MTRDTVPGVRRRADQEVQDEPMAHREDSGGPAVVGSSRRPVALRPWLSPGLPFSVHVRFIPKDVVKASVSVAKRFSGLHEHSEHTKQIRCQLLKNVLKTICYTLSINSMPRLQKALLPPNGDSFMNSDYVTTLSARNVNRIAVSPNTDIKCACSNKVLHVSCRGRLSGSNDVSSLTSHNSSREETLTDEGGVPE